MNKYKIAVIVGSIRKDSLNKKLADAIIRIAPSEFSFMHVLISDLPLYNQDYDASMELLNTRTAWVTAR